MSKKITVIGSVNTDLVIQTPRVPKAGETITGTQFEVIPGGKGANQAVAASRQGGNVYLIGCIGNDDFGEQQRQTLLSDKVQLDYLSTISKATTGIAVILLEESGENRIILAPGANHSLTLEQVKASTELISSSDILIAQLETPIEAVTEAISIANQHQTPVILNPAPAIALNSELLKKVDYLVPNETEAQLLTGIKVTDPKTAEAAIIRLQEIGVSNVIITLGDQGVVLHDEKGFFHSPAISVEPLDTTAAGDTFIGSLAVHLCEGKPLRDAVNYARFASAIAVTRLGAQTSIPTREETENFILQSKGVQ